MKKKSATPKHSILDHVNHWEKRALEMTGHIDDIDQAFDQWLEERKALVEFHEQNKRLEKLAKHLRENWWIIRKFFWSKGDIGEFIGLPIDNIRQSKVEMIKLPEKIIDAAQKLEVWYDDVLVAEENEREIKKDYEQLVMNLKVKKA